MNRYGKQALPQASLTLAGAQYRVTRLDVQEWISRPYRCWAYVALDEHVDAPDPDAMLGRQAVLWWRNGDWGERTRGGVVTSLSSGDCMDTGRAYFAVVLEPRMAALQSGFDTRLLSRVQLDTFVQETLTAVGYRYPHAVTWLATGVPRRRLLLQAEESEFELIQRALARAGVYYAWSDGAEEDLWFVDDSSPLPTHDGVIALAPEAAPMDAFGAYGLDRCRVGKRMASEPAALVHERMWEDGRTVARVRRMRAEVERYVFRAWGSQADLWAGLRVNIQGLSRHGDKRDPAQTGRQLITYAHHRLSIEVDDDGNQRKGDAVRGGYEVYVEGIPDYVTYRAPEPRVRSRPLLMSARTVTQTPHRPDAYRHGGVRLRMPDDGVATEPVPRVTPYNSGGGRKPGWYTPLTADSRVLVSCLNHDPDMPVVLGVLPTARNGHVAAASKGRDGGYITDRGQGLRIDGAGKRAAAGSRVTLYTVNDHGMLEIGTAGEQQETDLVRLACEKGLLALESGGDQFDRVGGQRSDRVGSLERITVGESLRTRGQSDVHLRASSGLRMTGRDRLELASGGGLQLAASQGVCVEGGDGVQMRVRGGNGVWRTLNGHATLLARDGIHLRSRNGQVTVRNADGSGAVIVQSNGKVRLQGEHIQLNASGALTFNGEVDYQSGGSVPEPSIGLVSGELKPLPKVTGGGVARIDALDWPRQVEPDQTVAVTFTAERFEDGDTAEVKLYRTDGAGRTRGAPITSRHVELAAGRTLYRTDVTIPAAGGGCCEAGRCPAGLRFEVEAEGSRSLELSDVATVRQGVWFRLQEAPGIDVDALTGWLRQMPLEGDETGEPGAWYDATVAADGLLRFPPMDSSWPMELRLAYRVDAERHGGAEWVDAGIYALAGDDRDAEQRVTPGTPCVFQIDGPLAEPLTIRCLPSPVMVNLRPDPNDAPAPVYRLTDEQLDYFRALGNAVLFIHGYQVDQGSLPAVIRGARLEQISLTTHRWQALSVNVVVASTQPAGDNHEALLRGA